MIDQKWVHDTNNNSIITEKSKDVILSINSITITSKLVENIVAIHNSKGENSMVEIDYFLTKKSNADTIIRELIIETLYSNYYDKVNYEKIKNLKKGTWIFSGELKPVQFSNFLNPKNPRYFNMDKFTSEQWERFSKYTDFKTLDNKSLSTKVNGCRIISDEYAQWFNKNECWNLMPKVNSARKWELYEHSVRKLAKKDGITYEGI